VYLSCMKSVRRITRDIYEEELDSAYLAGYQDGLNDSGIYANFKITPSNFERFFENPSLHRKSDTPDFNLWRFLFALLSFAVLIFLLLGTSSSKAHASTTTPPTLSPSSGTDANFTVTFNSPSDIVYSFDCNDQYIQTLDESPTNISYTDSDCTHIGNTYKFLSAPADNLADSYCHTDLDTCKDFLTTAEYDYSQSDYRVFLDLPNTPTYQDWLLVSMWITFLLTLIAGRMFFPPLSNKV